MHRCSFCEWIPILPWPIWPLAGQCPLGQNVVVGSMMLLLAVRGKHCHEEYVWTPIFFTTAPHHGLVLVITQKFSVDKRSEHLQLKCARYSSRARGFAILASHRFSD